MPAQSKIKAAKPQDNGDRLGREDWILAAWESMGGGSLDNVKVNILAKKLGVTRGSFYWHFKSRQELIDALLDRWFAILGLREATQGALTETDDPKEQLWLIFSRVIRNINAGQSVALRLYAAKDGKLRRRIEDEDKRRLIHYAERFERMGHKQERALELGRIYMAVVVSEYLRNGARSRQERLDAARQIHETLISL